MARVDPYRQQTAARGDTSPALARVPNTAGAGIGDGLASFGAGLAQVGQQVVGERVQAQREAEERQTRTEISHVRMEALRLETEYQSRFDEKTRELPEDGEGIEEFVREDFGKMRGFITGSYKTEPGRMAAEEMVERLQQGFTQRAMQYRAGALGTVQAGRIDAAASNAEKIVNKDPSRYSEILAQAVTLIGEQDRVPAAARLRLQTDMVQRLSLAAGAREIENSPRRALAMLNSDKQPGWAQNLDLDNVDRLKSRARSEVSRLDAEARARMAEARSILAGDLQDAFAARSMGMPSTMPDRSRFVAAFGAEGGQRYAEQAQRWQVFDVVAEAAFQPPAEAMATLDRLKPTTQEGAAEGLQRYAQARQLYDEQRKRLEADPVAVLLSRDPALEQMRAAGAEANDPAAMGAYFAALRGRQESLGVAEVRLLPEQQRTRLAAMLTFNPEAPTARSQMLQTMEAAYGREFQNVLREVAPKLDGAARVMTLMDAPTAAIFDRATLAAKATEDVIKGSQILTTHADTAKRSIDRELAPFAETLNNAADRNERLAELRSAAEVLALDSVSRGTAPADAARAAVASIIGKFNVVEGARIPVGLNADAIMTGARKAQAAGLPGFDLLPPGGSARFRTPAETAAAIAADVRRRGVWMTAPDESGLQLYVPRGDQLAPLVDAAERPVRLSWGELQTQAAIPDNPREASGDRALLQLGAGLGDSR